MLLDIGSVLGGLGLAVVAFVVVILVCVIILRLLAVVLPPPNLGRDDQSEAPEDPEAEAAVDPVSHAEHGDDASAAGEAAVPEAAADQEG